MKSLFDYFYSFEDVHVRVRGRCRVRIYAGDANARTVVLTELDSNSGGSITESCARIATSLTTAKSLNPRTTRWIQHTPARDGEPALFEELRFRWDADRVAGEPQWRPIEEAQVEALTGESMEKLNRRLGDQEISREMSRERVTDHEANETERTA